MINLNNKVNKSLSLAAKLMTLALAFATVSCDKCDKDKKEEAEAKEVKLAIAAKKATLTDDAEKSVEIDITNNGDGEFDPSSVSDDFVIVVSKVTGKQDDGNTDLTEKKHTAFEFGGKAADGTADVTYKLKDLLTEKIESKKSKSIKFEFKGTEFDKAHVKNATVKFELKGKDKDDKDKKFGDTKVEWKRS